MKYPFILFFRDDKYKYIDTILTDNSSQLNCTLHIINKMTSLEEFAQQILKRLRTNKKVTKTRSTNGLK